MVSNIFIVLYFLFSVPFRVVPKDFSKTKSTNFSNRPVELLPVNKDRISIAKIIYHAVIFIKSYKYCHFHPNISSHYLFLSTRIEVALYLILRFMILIHDITIIYICLPQIKYQCKKSSFFWK